MHPQIKDKTVQTNFDRHYIYHTAWAARILVEKNIQKHIDVSSSLYFSSIVSAFIPIDFYDYRPANIQLSDLQSHEGNLLALPFKSNSVQSLSCMHTIEHIGLGRYGDVLDPEADLKAIAECIRVLAPGGIFLFVTPIGGSPQIEFNAHRIYTFERIMNYFKDLVLEEFAFIPEHDNRGGLIRHANPDLTQREHYGCGCFLFSKK